MKKGALQRAIGRGVIGAFEKMTVPRSFVGGCVRRARFQSQTPTHCLLFCRRFGEWSSELPTHCFRDASP